MLILAGTWLNVNWHCAECFYCHKNKLSHIILKGLFFICKCVGVHAGMHGCIYVCAPICGCPWRPYQRTSFPGTRVPVVVGTGKQTQVPQQSTKCSELLSHFTRLVLHFSMERQIELSFEIYGLFSWIISFMVYLHHINHNRCKPLLQRQRATHYKCKSSFQEKM